MIRRRGRVLAAAVAAALLPATVALADPLGSGGADDFELESRPSPDPANGPTDYVTLTDGTVIAVNVSVPEGCDAATPCPAVFEMSGYESGSADGDTPSGSIDDAKDGAINTIFGDAAGPYEHHHETPLQGGTRASHGVFHDDEYAVVLASVRGTGCSGGEFDLFSWRSALDGRELIDGWIAKQDWSNGDVAIFGHSYSGITGTMVAATQPRHLRTISVSGLVGDVYRDIVYPGGVTNYGFPLLWTGAIRPLYDVGGGVGGGLIGKDVVNPDPICAEQQAAKSRTALNDPLVHGLQDTDSEWYRARSLYSSVANIGVPVHITTAYQDEQTGPRGAYTVWDHLPDGISKRLVNSNGVHGTQTSEYIRQDRLAWLDYWMLGRDLPASGEAAVFDEYGVAADGSGLGLDSVFGPRAEATSSTRTFLGLQADREVAQLWSDQFPYRQTDFRELFVTRTGGGLMLGTELPAAADSEQWFNGSRRQSYSHQAGRDNGAELSTPAGPDELEISMDFAEDTVLAGPAIASLWVSSSAPETELFVQLIDESPAGEMLYLQRGMLRGGHRAIDAGKSGYFTETAQGSGGETVMWRPFRPHTASTPVQPGQPVRYDIEIFPVGHVFKAGHRLTVKVHAPPADDNDYMYVPKAPPTVNTLHFGPATPSSLLLPTVALSDLSTFGDIPADLCGSYTAMRCVKRGQSPF